MWLRGPTLELVLQLQENLVGCANGLVEVSEGTLPLDLALADVLEGVLALHALLDAVEVFFVLEVELFNVVELLLSWLIGPESLLVKKVPVPLGLLQHLQRHLQRVVLELYDEEHQ